MLYGLYLSAAGALVESSRIDVSTNNMANINTPGFKDDLALISARDAAAIEQTLPAFATPLDAIGGGALLSETRTRFAQGPVNKTENPFDMAIDGEGFFRVSDGKGQYFTRAGNFTRDTSGRLVTPDGKYYLCDSAGRPVAVPVDGSPEITRDGTVSVDGAPVSRIDLVGFSDLRALSKVGNNVYVNRGADEIVGGVGSIEQKALEMSSVSPAVEIARMITAQRGYDANMQLMRMQDQTLGELVNIGRVVI